MVSVSVVIPNYNYASYLPESLGAILNQTFKPLEIIIVDDASTDESVAVIKKFQKKYPHFHFIINHINRGACATVNSLISTLKGDYVALCAADDIVDPHFLERTIEVAKNSPELAIISGEVRYFDDKKPYVFNYSPKLPDCKATKIFTPFESIKIFRKAANFICSPATLYKRDMLLRFNGYEAPLESLCDFYLNCKAALHYPIAYIPEPLASVRMHVVNGSYGDRIRKSLKKRMKATRYLLELVFKKEGRAFKKAFFQADLFSRIGYFLIYTVAFTPKYWHYLPLFSYRVLKRKINRHK